MAQLTGWTSSFNQAYRSKEHCIIHQQVVLERVTARSRWVLEELKTWSQYDQAPKERIDVLRAELTDLTLSLRHIRSYHETRNRELTRKTQSLAHHAQIYGTLPEMVRYELEVHRQMLGLAQHLQRFAPKEDERPTRQAD